MSCNCQYCKVGPALPKTLGCAGSPFHWGLTWDCHWILFFSTYLPPDYKSGIFLWCHVVPKVPAQDMLVSYKLQPPFRAELMDKWLLPSCFSSLANLRSVGVRALPKIHLMLVACLMIFISYLCSCLCNIEASWGGAAVDVHSSQNKKDHIVK